MRRIVALRWRHSLGPVAIADRLGVAPSTAHRVLLRCRINRLSHLDRATGEPICRYEHPTPGDLLHVDVKKLGNIPDGGGWRFVGRAQGNMSRPLGSAPLILGEVAVDGVAEPAFQRRSSSAGVFASASSRW
jgi:hypothetical protein